MKNKLSSSTIDESYKESGSVEELYDKIHNCKECPLGETRTKFVFGTGNPNADAMLIGEAPGADEDKQGEPFVGRAGKLLTDILTAIQFKREDVFIANILKCRPPNNRDPLPEETDTCFPYLDKQIELIKPKIILCLGRVAANGLLNKKMTLGEWRKDEHEYKGIKVIVTYHPAALLRNPNWKRGCWEDVKIFRKYYDELTK
ncbi:DNA polymerase [bacterium BRH_c32]|nr:MAG: DNA polymerase [bacterium BRH_c32]